MTHLEYYVEVEGGVDYHEGASDVRQEAAQAEADHPNANWTFVEFIERKTVYGEHTTSHNGI